LALALIGAGSAIAARARLRTRGIDFAGKTVVIFGGSRGLGLAMARELAYQDARLVLVARDRQELDRARDDIESRGGSVSIIECDIRNRAQVEDTIARIIAERGVLDVLINDAGIIQAGPLENMTIEDFEVAMATHFWGPVFTILAALPHMRRSGAKRIVNISSIAGKIALPRFVPYSVSKFALTGFSEGLHAELAREGFRVTTVFPALMPSTTAGRAAHQVIEACRYGDAELIVSLPARVAVLLNAAVPGTVATMMELTNAMLPKAAHEDGFGPHASEISAMS
jgi:NAD(P)-dependent dehydrogenase (short-subunit alcohol dehydrogenase family)